eukprot:tig00021108_g18305.t1
MMLVEKPATAAELLAPPRGGPSGARGEPSDLLHGGFDLLVESDIDRFAAWVESNEERVNRVVGEVLAKSWEGLERSAAAGRRDALDRLSARRQARLAKRDKAAAEEQRAHAARLADLRARAEATLRAEREAYRKRRQARADRSEFAARTWRRWVRVLYRERALWGPSGPALSFFDPQEAWVAAPPEEGWEREDGEGWQLDPTEGPLRMRRKLMRARARRRPPASPAGPGPGEPKAAADSRSAASGGFVLRDALRTPRAEPAGAPEEEGAGTPAQSPEQPPSPPAAAAADEAPQPAANAGEEEETMTEGAQASVQQQQQQRQRWEGAEEAPPPMVAEEEAQAEARRREEEAAAAAAEAEEGETEEEEEGEAFEVVDVRNKEEIDEKVRRARTKRSGRPYPPSEPPT